MRYHVTHTTAYRYSEPVTLCHNALHLIPRPCGRQRCLRSEVRVEPVPRVTHDQIDYFGNPSTLFCIQEPHLELIVSAHSTVDVPYQEPPELADTPAWESVRDAVRTDRSPEALEAYQFAYDSRYIPRSDELAAYAMPSFTPGRPLAEAAFDLTRRVYRDFRYDPKATTISTPVHEVLAKRHGVCQDFAHVQIGCLRSLGLPARYVSGYLRTKPPPGRKRLRGADASHAWLAVYCPGHGWIDYDPTNDQIPTDHHITLAWGRDYEDVSPVRGVILGGGYNSMRVSVDVSTDEEDQDF